MSYSAVRVKHRVFGALAEKVTGIGSLFFRARQPQALAEWYRNHLGVDVVSDNYDDPPWQQQAGPTDYAPFPEDTKYFGDPAKQWMVNFRVANLDAMVAQLRPATRPRRQSDRALGAGRPRRHVGESGQKVSNQPGVLWPPQ
jgi:hypothetical protein